jgi:hypothetical protein
MVGPTQGPQNTFLRADPDADRLEPPWGNSNCDRPVWQKSVRARWGAIAGRRNAADEMVIVQSSEWLEIQDLECIDVTRSRVIRRICYDESTGYMLVDVAGRYHEFCGVDRTTLEQFVSATSITRFFARIRRNHPCG